MKRDLIRLTQTQYDLCIVGGGLYGLFIAWEAVLRGLQVCLVEQGDFGHATSSNSLRIIHGGLRYLQHGAFSRMRQSIRERRMFLRIAPHLIHPQPFLFPTYGHGLRGKEVFSLALFLHDLIGFDRNHGLQPPKYLRPSQVISKGELQRLVPGMDREDLTGGALCYDAQMLNPERFLISLAQSADQLGAHLANYVKVTGFLGKEEHVQGVKVRDVLSDDELDIQADLVINASGPWVNQVLKCSSNPRLPPVASFGRAFNLLIKRQLVPQYALGVYSRQKYKDTHTIVQKGSRLYIITPCQHGSLIGTAHLPVGPEPPSGGVTEEEIMAFVHDLNEAYPGGAIQSSEIAWVYWGNQPRPSGDHEVAQYPKQYEIKDHEREEGIKGLISVVGVKFTEARQIAEKIINLVFKKRLKTSSSSMTALTPIYGGNIDDVENFVKRKGSEHSDRLSEEILRSLISKYGTAYRHVLNFLDEVRGNWPTLSMARAVNLAEIKYGVREEGAQKLSDAVFRRMTIDFSQSPPEKDFLELCGECMSKEMGWSVDKQHHEFREVEHMIHTGRSSLS